LAHRGLDTKGVPTPNPRHRQRVDYVTDVGDDASPEAARLDQLAERIKVGAAVIAGLLFAFATSVTLLYFALVLVARHIYGTEGPD
jgi:hypothetical protein